jgi:hypothetical protein
VHNDGRARRSLMEFAVTGTASLDSTARTRDRYP